MTSKTKMLISLVLASIITPFIVYVIKLSFTYPMVTLNVIVFTLLALMVGILFGSLFAYIYDLLDNIERNRHLGKK